MTILSESGQCRHKQRPEAEAYETGPCCPAFSVNAHVALFRLVRKASSFDGRDDLVQQRIE